MKLQDAIKIASEHQDKVGTLGGAHNTLIEAIIPAPIIGGTKLFGDFVTGVKEQLLYVDRTKIDFAGIAGATGAVDFDVFVLYEGTLHRNPIEKTGNIVWGKLKY